MGVRHKLGGQARHISLYLTENLCWCQMNHHKLLNRRKSNSTRSLRELGLPPSMSNYLGDQVSSINIVEPLWR